MCLRLLKYRAQKHVSNREVGCEAALESGQGERMKDSFVSARYLYLFFSFFFESCDMVKLRVFLFVDVWMRLVDGLPHLHT